MASGSPAIVANGASNCVSLPLPSLARFDGSNVTKRRMGARFGPFRLIGQRRRAETGYSIAAKLWQQWAALSACDAERRFGCSLTGRLFLFWVFIFFPRFFLFSSSSLAAAVHASSAQKHQATRTTAGPLNNWLCLSIRDREKRHELRCKTFCNEIVKIYLE